MPDQILISLLILATLAGGGALLLWRLWVSIKNLFNSNNHTVPKNIRISFFGGAFCIIAVPLIPAVFFMIQYYA